MSLRSAIYAGDVMHSRLRPKAHRLHYKVFSLLLDLDELEALSASSKLFGFNRPAPLSFWEKDHGDGTTDGLRAWVEDQMRAAGHAPERPRIEVLCYPRMWGYVFNPLTVYFCHQGGALRTILYEVCNTFGERRTYVIPVAAGESGPVRQSCAKEHYVSPFIAMDCSYDFLIKPPADRVLVRIDDIDAGGLLLRASFSGRRQALTDRSLLGVLLKYPLMTLKVTGAIHFEALRLWLKGVPVLKHIAARERIATTIVLPADHPARNREAETVG